MFVIAPDRAFILLPCLVLFVKTIWFSMLRSKKPMLRLRLVEFPLTGLTIRYFQGIGFIPAVRTESQPITATTLLRAPSSATTQSLEPHSTELTCGVLPTLLWRVTPL